MRSRDDQGRPLLQSVQVDSRHPPLLKPLVFSILAALGPLAFGFGFRFASAHLRRYTMGFTSPVGDDLKKSTDDGGLGLTDDQNSLFGSMVNVGAMIGAMSGGVLADRFGRVG